MNEQDKPKRATQRVRVTPKLANRDATLQKGGLLTNCYEEPTPKGDRAVKRPGLVPLGPVPTAPNSAQGATYFNGWPVYIVGDTLYTRNYPVTFGGISFGSGSSGAMGITSGKVGAVATIKADKTGLLFTDAGLVYRLGKNSSTYSAITSIASDRPSSLGSGNTTYLTFSGSFAKIFLYDKNWSAVTSFSAPPFGGTITFFNSNYWVGFVLPNLINVYSETGALVTSYSPTAPGRLRAMSVYNNSIWLVYFDISIGLTTVEQRDSNFTLLSTWTYSYGRFGVPYIEPSGIAVNASEIWISTGNPGNGVYRHTYAGALLSYLPIVPGYDPNINASYMNVVYDRIEKKFYCGVWGSDSSSTILSSITFDETTLVPTAYLLAGTVGDSSAFFSLVI